MSFNSIISMYLLISDVLNDVFSPTVDLTCERKGNGIFMIGVLSVRDNT